MSPTDQLFASGWLGVYYDRVAQRPKFSAKSIDEQWSALRTEVLAGPPLNDETRREAFDSIPASRRVAILARFSER